MISRLLVYICLCFTLSGYTQKSYEFDYVAEYKFNSRNKDSISRTRYEFFNSKDNSYTLSVNDHDKYIYMSLSVSNGKTYFGKIDRDDFFVEAISLKCPMEWSKKNSDYESLKEYQIKKLPDTIINTSPYKYFLSDPLNKSQTGKKAKRTVYYVMDNTGNFKFPFLNPQEILYRKWKNENNIPNGLIKEIYTEKNNKKELVMELVQYVATKKLILIDSNCH